VVATSGERQNGAATDADAALDFRAVADAMPEGVLVLARDLRVIYANPVAARRICLPAEELTNLEIPLHDTDGHPTPVVLCVEGVPRPLVVVARPLTDHPEGLIVAVARDVRQAGVEHDQVLASQMRDELTGLLNRRGLRFAIEQIQRTRPGDSRSYALLLLDVDNLEEINDRYGHSEGDHAIREAARLLRSALRASDAVARYGGDEFVALLPDVRRRDLEQIRRRLQRLMDDDNARGNNPFRVTFSLGAAFVQGATTVPLQRLLDEADAAMYRHKHRRAERPSHAAVRPVGED